MTVKNMNKNIKKIISASAFAIATLLLSAGLVQASTFAPITSHLGVGSTGSNVSNLQTFLASDYNTYPAALVTGYYGPLTEAAVKQFQLDYGIPMLGNVGPMTFGAVNRIMSTGYGIDMNGPTIYNVSAQPSQNSVTINWTATGYAYGKVYYSSTPFNVAEAVGNFSDPTIIGGLNVSTVYATNGQSVTVSNLQPNTAYYYIVEVTDASGNVSVTNTLTFATN